MNTVTAVIIALGSLAGLVLWLLKRMYGKPSSTRKLRKLQEKVDEVTSQMSRLLAVKPFNRQRYNELKFARKLLNKQIARLRGVSGKS